MTKTFEDKLSSSAAIIRSTDIDWLMFYLRNAAPSGREIFGQQIWLDFIKTYCDPITSTTMEQ